MRRITLLSAQVSGHFHDTETFTTCHAFYTFGKTAVSSSPDGALVLAVTLAVALAVALALALALTSALALAHDVTCTGFSVDGDEQVPAESPLAAAAESRRSTYTNVFVPFDRK